MSDLDRYTSPRYGRWAEPRVVPSVLVILTCPECGDVVGRDPPYCRRCDTFVTPTVQEETA